MARQKSSNYYLGADHSRWHRAVPTFPRLRYAGIAAGIDLVFHGQDGALEYDFLLAPGADPARIRLAFSGSRVSLEGGDLVFGSSGIRFRRPEVYQEIAGHRTGVAGKFVLRQDGSAGFQVGAYDHSQPLVIDPVVTYATTFYGYTTSLNSALAPDGSIVMVGTTSNSLNAQEPLPFPTSVGAFQTTLGGVDDAFVFKLDPTGTQVLFSTYLGGSGYDDPLGLAVDGSGAIYVSGRTNSPNFPLTSGAYAASCPPAAPDCARGFLAKFNSGGALVYSALPEAWGPVAVDQQGNGYVTGVTTSPSLPLVNPLQSSVPSKQVANGEFATQAGLVEELNSSGSGLVFSTYLAGKNSDIPKAIAVDGGGNIYVTGTTASPDFPVKNPVQFGGTGGVFLTKLAPSGAALLYSTLVGTGTPSALAVDGNGTAFVAGSQSADPVGLASGMVQPCYPGCVEGFVRALDSSGAHLTATANLGIAPVALALDAADNIYLAGTLGEFPLLSPVQAEVVGGSYVVELNSAGQPAFSTRLGADRVAVDATSLMVRNGTIYVAGIAFGGNSNLDFPYEISGAMQPWFTPLSCRSGVNMTGCNSSEVPVLMMIGSGPGPQLNVTALEAVPAVVQNLSSTPLNIQSISAPNLPNAQIGGTCGSQLPAGGKCLLYVSAPQSTTTNPTTVTINSDATPSSQQFSVVYVDTSSPPLLAPYLYYPPNQALDFGPVRNFESATRTVHMLNAGPIAAHATVGAAGALQESDDCSTIPANGQCTITLTFSPSPTSTSSTGFGISSSTSIYSFTARPTVDGIGVDGSLWSSVGQLDFGTEALAATGFPRVVLIQNADNLPISLTGISATGDFTASSNCPASLAPGASCVASVQFAPTAVETASGKLLINHSGDMNPVVVQLQGIAAIASDLQISGPTYIAPEPLGSSSPAEPWTVTNVSSHQVTISSISASGDFSATGCLGALSAAASCTGTVTFTPSAAGPRDGTLSIAHDGVGSPQLGRLHGFGGVVWPVPESLDFFNQIVGTTGSSRSLTLSNTTGQPVAVSSITISPAEFALTSGCGSSLPVQGCSMQLSFTPKAAGPRQGTVTIVTASPAETLVIPLQGVGISTDIPFTDLQISPSPLNVGTAEAGTRSASSPVPVTISNTGNANLVINSIVTSGNFTVSNNCPAAVAPGGQCTAQVIFHPTGAGMDSGTLSVNANVVNSPRSINLSGTGADFQFVAAFGTTSQTVTGGQSATFSLQIGGTAGFSDTVSLACTQVPAGYGCSFSPPSVPVGSTPANFTVTVTTPARAGGMTLPWSTPIPPAFFLWSGALALPLALCLRRRRMFAAVTASLAVALLISCGGGGSSSSKTITQPLGPVNEVITVTATSGAGGSHDIPLFLTVN